MAGHTSSGSVALRSFPYPYKAALAICSDLDETPDASAYFEMMRFLNTTSSTACGDGVGLEVGNTIYFDMPSDQFSYWNTDDAGRARVRALMQSGHVDCLHSFGDLAATRAHAARALEDLERHGCRLRVWIDHAVAPSNFGRDVMRGAGDVEASSVYHADLTSAFGIEYVWRGRVTSVLGQNRPRRLSGIANPLHPFSSSVTILKESAKGALASLGSRKYGPHASNEVLWPDRLRSGHPVYEFMRSNPSSGGVSCNETADGFGEVVTGAFVKTLVDREATCILYTHLGKIRDRSGPLRAATRGAFARLGIASANGELLVTTTCRLLDYSRLMRECVWSARDDGSVTRIDLQISSALDRKYDPRWMSGLTFYVDRPDRTTIVVNGAPWAGPLMSNPPDQTGRASVSIPWTRLVFPQL
jgi:hypothetical protein